jgi:hypothetical protein
MAKPHVQVIQQTWFAVALAVSVAGCDLRGGSQVERLSSFDRFRLESLKAVAADLPSNTRSAEITIAVPPQIRGNEHVLKRTKIEYLFRRDKSGLLLYEARHVHDSAAFGDKFGKVLLARRPDGEIRFLSLRDWDAEVNVGTGALTAVSVVYRSDEQPR